MESVEIWKDIVGYEGLYQVSNNGNVKRIEHEDFKCRQGYRVFKERMLKPFKNFRGYMKVGLSKGNKKKDVFVHRLVAEAFIENPCNYPQVNHKDEDKTNNCVDNLEWCTRKYNNNYGTKPERTRKAMMGNTNGRKAMGMTIAIDKLYMNKMPKSCKECPLTYLDSGDDAYFGANERRCVIDDSCIDGMVSERAYDCPLVEAIPKADYENRLKTDMVAMLTEIQLECEENTVRWYVGRVDGKSDDVVLMETINDIIQQKINALKEN